MTRLKDFVHMHAGAGRANAREAIRRTIRQIEQLAKSGQADAEDRQAATDEINKLYELERSL